MSFSFLSGKSPFDEAEEKLEAGENPSGKPKLPTPTMGWQDVVLSRSRMSPPRTRAG